MLEDVLPSNLRRAAAELVSVEPVSALRFAGSIEDAVRDADLVIDTVPDELESKLEILTLLDRMAPPGTLFATPTEALSIADLASCTYRAAQCFGLRFSMVSEQMHIALSYPPVCEAATVRTMTAFLQALGAMVQAAPDERALP